LDYYRDILYICSLILVKYTPQLAGGNLVLGFQGGV
jgi:hypothetical protein